MGVSKSDYTKRFKRPGLPERRSEDRLWLYALRYTAGQRSMIFSMVGMTLGAIALVGLLG